jgi:hypothetical protein
MPNSDLHFHKICDIDDCSYIYPSIDKKNPLFDKDMIMLKKKIGGVLLRTENEPMTRIFFRIKITKMTLTVMSIWNKEKSPFYIC